MGGCQPSHHQRDRKKGPAKRGPGRRTRKPSSVPAMRRRSAGGVIHLGHASPRASSDATRKHRAGDPRRFPISSCSGWGLPCDRRCRRPGELLPHPFTLAARSSRGGRGGLLSVALSRGHPRQALPGTLPCGARTFLPCDPTRPVPHRRSPASLRPPSFKPPARIFQTPGREPPAGKLDRGGLVDTVEPCLCARSPWPLSCCS